MIVCIFSCMTWKMHNLYIIFSKSHSFWRNSFLVIWISTSYRFLTLKISTTGSSIYIGPLDQFLKFLLPFQKNFKTNDTSIESTNKGLLDSWEKLGMAPSWGWACFLSWKSITFTKTCLEPSMTKILAVSKLFSNNG